MPRGGGGVGKSVPCPPYVVGIVSARAYMNLREKTDASVIISASLLTELACGLQLKKSKHLPDAPIQIRFLYPLKGVILTFAQVFRVSKETSFISTMRCT